MAETIHEWQKRKYEQCARIVDKYPALKIDDSGDYRTTFVLVDMGRLTAIVIGQLPWNGRQPSIDLSDDEVYRCLEHLSPQG